MQRLITLGGLVVLLCCPTSVSATLLYTDGFESYTAGGNPFYAYPYMLRRSMVFGGDDLDAFKAKLVTFVRTGARTP